MSTTAEDISTTLNSQESSVEPIDAVAALLLDGEESPDEDVKDDENLSEASTTEDDSDVSDENDAEDDTEEDEETTLEAVADDDVTWETTLGVTDGDLSFDEEGNLVGFNTKVNGESETIDAKTLLAGYQTNKAITQKSQALGEERKAFEGQKKQTEQVYASKLESVDALSQYFEKQLISEYDGVDWDRLRNENPAEYAAAKSDFSEKAGELERIKNAISADKEALNKTQSDNQNASNQEYFKSQFDLMISNNPEWKDDSVRKVAKAAYQTFVTDKYGFTDQEFDTVFDARLIELIKDAKKYHEGKAVAAKKMTKPVPKFQKSRGKVKAKTSKLEKLTLASKTAHGDVKRDLQTSAIASLLTGA